MHQLSDLPLHLKYRIHLLYCLLLWWESEGLDRNETHEWRWVIVMASDRIIMTDPVTNTQKTWELDSDNSWDSICEAVDHAYSLTSLWRPYDKEQ